MKGQSVVFSKGKDNWQTPPDLFLELDQEFNFTLDAAADASNHFCDRWLGPGSDISEDALTWKGEDETIFCNPPYSNIAEFVKWADSLSLNTLTTKVVMLIPSRTDTKYWHAHIWDREKHQPHPNVQVRFIKGRVKFIDPFNPEGRNSAPFPSVIVVFG